VLNYKIEKKRKNSGSKSKGNKYILKEKKKKSKDPREKKGVQHKFFLQFYLWYIDILNCNQSFKSLW